MSETPSSGHPDASTIVAQSLATVGYAMFSLCRSEPLAQIPSFGEFMSHVDERAQEVAPTAEEPSAFGESSVDENLAAPTPASAPPAEAPLPVVTQGGPASAASAMLVIGPDGRPVTPAAPVEGEEPPAPPVAAPKPLPEYNPNPNHTMAALQEISFLDE